MIQKSMDKIADDALNGNFDPNKIINSTQTISQSGLFSSFSLETIIIGIIASIIGVYYIKTGRKDGKIVALLCGIGLCGITYFVQDTRYLLGICLILAIIPIFFKN